MKTLIHETVASRAAEFLRQRLKSGAWRESLPGIRKLAEELGISRDSARLAVRQLEREGWLKTAGSGRARGIPKKTPAGRSPRQLNVVLLLFEPEPTQASPNRAAILSILMRLEADGHSVQVATLPVAPTLRALKRKVESIQADAWILHRAPKSAIEWFIQQQRPAFAIGGMTKGLPIAANTVFMAGAVEQAVRHLRQLGHRRIVLLTPSFLRHPAPSSLVVRFQEVMAQSGIPMNDYHLPAWEESPAGLHQLLEALFAVTPPTALLVHESRYLQAIASFFNRRRILVPRDCSLILMYPDPASDWWQPPLARFRWKDTRHLQHLSRWLKSVRAGQSSMEQHHQETEFTPGETVAAAKS